MVCTYSASFKGPLHNSPFTLTLMAFLFFQSDLQNCFEVSINQNSDTDLGIKVLLVYKTLAGRYSMKTQKITQESLMEVYSKGYLSSLYSVQYSHERHLSGGSLAWHGTSICHRSLSTHHGICLLCIRPLRPRSELPFVL